VVDDARREQVDEVVLGVSLKKKGIDIHTSTKVTKIEKTADGFNVFAEGKKGEIQVSAERVLISTGRIPVTEGLNLEAVGVDFDRKGIKVDNNFKTTAKNVYAIGDVNGKMMLAHVASHQGIKVIEEIAGISSYETTQPVPSCVFIFPEIATVGMTEDEAKNRGMEYKVSKFMFGANGKALALGETEGMVKVLCDNNNTIIGVHIMGPHASDLIHEGTLAVTKKLNVDDIARTIHAHPTLSETFSEAVLGLKGEAIHMIPSRK
jgi:dihydrolipoamide dehydrogenase